MPAGLLLAARVRRFVIVVTGCIPDMGSMPAMGSFPGERPQGGPPGDMAGFGTPQKNQSEQWIQLAVCAALIIAALLVMQKIRPHNQ